MKTTKEAFEELISKRGWWVDILPNRQTAQSYKERFKAGTLTISSMESILEKAGYNVVQEKMWEK